MRATNSLLTSGAGAHLAVALARSDLSPSVREFLNDLGRRGRPMTPQQAAAVERSGPARPIAERLALPTPTSTPAA